MSAATENRDAKKSDGWVQNYKGHSGYHVYAGTLVMGTSAGYIRPFATGETQAWFAGVAWDEIDTSSTNSDITVADGAEEGRVWIRGTFTFDANGTPAQNHIGKTAYAVDDKTVGISHAGAWRVGKVVDYTSDTYRIQIDNYVGLMKGASGWYLSQDQGTPTAP